MNDIKKPQSPHLIKTFISVVWPSFLSAILATVVFFFFFDPINLTNCAYGEAQCRYSAYTIGFILFLLLGIINSVLTCYFRGQFSK